MIQRGIRNLQLTCYGTKARLTTYSRIFSMKQEICRALNIYKKSIITDVSHKITSHLFPLAKSDYKLLKYCEPTRSSVNHYQVEDLLREPKGFGIKFSSIKIITKFRSNCIVTRRQLSAIEESRPIIYQIYLFSGQSSILTRRSNGKRLFASSGPSGRHP